MCGIAGVVTSDRPIADAPALARRLSDALAYRGPDGEGVWTSPSSNVVLVHRRLAIIDVGPSGAQPMATPNLRHHLVFNGEIYNYRELRRELEARGERFATASDTEVLLLLIAREGPAALARLRGMFALACWDAVDRSLLLARDRFGIKPLYIAATPNALAFASELCALDAAGLVAPTPSAAGVLAFLAWGSVPPPLTWRHGVEMLAPGTWRMRRIDGREAQAVFADTRDAYRSDRRQPLSEAALREAVGEAVRESVRARRGGEGGDGSAPAVDRAAGRPGPAGARAAAMAALRRQQRTVCRGLPRSARFRPAAGVGGVGRSRAARRERLAECARAVGRGRTCAARSDRRRIAERERRAAREPSVSLLATASRHRCDGHDARTRGPRAVRRSRARERGVA